MQTTPRHRHRGADFRSAHPQSIMQTTSNNRPNLRQGFTLIEILVVIAIIAVLATMTAGGLKWYKRKAAIDKTKVLIGQIGHALEAYRLDNGTFPTGDGLEQSSQDLYIALYGDSDGDGKPDPAATIYLDILNPDLTGNKGNVEEIGSNYLIIDAWKEPIRYQNPPTMNPDFDLWSLGPDGVGGPNSGNEKDREDDINNW